MQKPEMKSAIKIAGMSADIPSSKTKVAVGSLLTQPDLERIDEYHIGTIGVKIKDGVYFLPKAFTVPAESSILRDEQGQLLGIPTIAGG